MHLGCVAPAPGAAGKKAVVSSSFIWPEEAGGAGSLVLSGWTQTQTTVVLGEQAEGGRTAPGRGSPGGPDLRSPETGGLVCCIQQNRFLHPSFVFVFCLYLTCDFSVLS